MKINIILDNVNPSNQSDINIKNFGQLSNGSIEEIYCDILDYIDYQNRTVAIINMLKKCKNNGEICIKFLDSIRIMKDYASGKISSQQLSDIIKNMQSVNNESDILDIVSDNPHFRILKKYNDNYYKVIYLHKKI